MPGTIILKIDGQRVKVRWNGANAPTPADVGEIERTWREANKPVSPMKDLEVPGFTPPKRNPLAFKPDVDYNKAGGIKETPAPRGVAPQPPKQENAFTRALGVVSTPTVEQLTKKPKRDVAKQFPKRTPEQEANNRAYEAAKVAAAAKGIKPPKRPSSPAEMQTVLDFVRQANGIPDQTEQSQIDKTAKEIEAGTSFGTNDPMAGKSINEAQDAMTRKFIHAFGLNEDSWANQMVLGMIPAFMADLGVTTHSGYSPAERVGSAANVASYFVGGEVLAGKMFERVSSLMHNMGKPKAAQFFEDLSHPLQSFLKSQKDPYIDDIARSVEKGSARKAAAAPKPTEPVPTPIDHQRPPTTIEEAMAGGSAPPATQPKAGGDKGLVEGFVPVRAQAVTYDKITAPRKGKQDAAPGGMYAGSAGEPLMDAVNRAAWHSIKDGKERYLFPTANGYNITTDAPALGLVQRYVHVRVDGEKVHIVEFKDPKMDKIIEATKRADSEREAQAINVVGEIKARMRAGEEFGFGPDDLEVQSIGGIPGTVVFRGKPMSISDFIEESGVQSKYATPPKPPGHPKTIEEAVATPRPTDPGRAPVEQGGAGNAKEQVPPLVDGAKTPDQIALEHRYYRKQLEQRYKSAAKGGVSELAKISPDDARLDPFDDAFDPKLVEAIYKRHVNRSADHLGVDAFQSGTPEAAARLNDVREWLNNQWEREALNESTLAGDAQRHLEELNAALARPKQPKVTTANADDVTKIVRSAKARGGDDFYRAYRNRDGSWRIDARQPAVFVRADAFSPDLSKILLQEGLARGNTDARYIQLNAWKRHLKEGNGRFQTLEELMQAEGDVADIAAGEMAHKSAVGIPKQVVVDYRDNLAEMIRRAREETKPINEPRLSEQVDREIPMESPPAEPNPARDTSARQADLQRDRFVMDQAGITKTEARPWQELLDKGNPKSAKYLNDKKTWSDQDNANAILRLAELKQEHREALAKVANATGDDLELLGREIQDLEKEHAELTEKMHRAGSEQGRALASRKLMLDGDMSLIQAKSAMRAKAGRPLTAKENQTLESLYSRISAQDERIALLETQRASRTPQAGAQTAKRTPRFDKDALDAELNDLLEQGKRALAKIGSIPDPELAVIVGKVAINYAKRGINSLDEIVAHVQETFRGLGHELDRQAVIDAMAEPQQRKSTRTELQVQVAKLKAEAKRLSTAKREADAARVNAQIADYQHQLESGDYHTPTKRELQIDKEIQALRNERDLYRSKVQAAVRAATQSPTKRFMKGVAGTVRGTILGSDIGVLTRQGLFGLSRPVEFAKSVKAGVKAAFSEATLAKIERDILSHEVTPGVPAGVVYRKHKLSLTDHLNNPEELIVAKIFRKIPGIKYLAGAGERFQAAFINTLRSETMDRAIRLGYKENELTARANFINSATGRSNIQNVPAALEVVMTSPRYEASRWEMLAQPLRNLGVLGKDAITGKGLNRGAIANIQDMAVTAAEVYGLYKLAELSGYEVEWDPTSSDFLKMRRGDEVWDPSAGIAPRLRDTIRFVAWGMEPTYNDNAQKVLAAGITRPISPAVRQPIEVASQAVQRSRGVPESKIASMFSGWKLDEDQKGWITFAPLIIQTAKKYLDEGDYGGAASAGARELVGQSVNRYPKPKPKRP